MWVRGLKLCKSEDLRAYINVAPCVGAWIETGNMVQLLQWSMSHPVWVRGLKLEVTLSNNSDYKSHPVWVRGLKLLSGLILAPLNVSHPVWVRGLKQSFDILTLRAAPVAPCVGAWIETPTD